MKVTGYKLRAALRRWQLRRDTAAGQFEASLKAFPGEDKPKPDDIARAVLDAERAIARLQVAQVDYNARVSLLENIKTIGGLARVEKLWRGAAGGKKDRRTTIYDIVHARDKDQIVAKPTISPDEAAKRAEAVGRELAALREAIATGNATEREIEDLDPSLFE